MFINSPLKYAWLPDINKLIIKRWRKKQLI
jgi:hypothetical protein